MNNTWFTSDTHFGHRNILTHCDRPFESIEVHDEALIANWNDRVQAGDVVYHLGDFALCKRDKALQILQRLNGQIHLIRGNHDKVIRGIEDQFVCVRNYHEVKGKDPKKIVLSHYAHRVWNASHKGSWHLFGHSHGDLADYGLSTDVGVDRWDYAPVSLEQIRKYMENKAESKGDFDHHGEDR